MTIDAVPTLIGGPARVGKTTLARRLAIAYSAELVHLDHLLHAVSAVATGEELAALQTAPSVDTCNASQWLVGLRVRDCVLWKAAHAYLTAARGELVVEGGLWPDWVATLDRPHAAVFIVDTSADMAARLVEMTRTDPDSWMARRRWPVDKIRKWAAYNRIRSEMIADQATRHNYPVFDIAATGLSATQDRALRHLTAPHAPQHAPAGVNHG